MYILELAVISNILTYCFRYYIGINSIVSEEIDTPIKNIEFLRQNITKFKQPLWVEIWNINTVITNLEDDKNLSWNLYFKYKLSMIKSWHILEERFLIFFLLLIICFF